MECPRTNALGVEFAEDQGAINWMPFAAFDHSCRPNHIWMQGKSGLLGLGLGGIDFCSREGLARAAQLLRQPAAKGAAAENAWAWRHLFGFWNLGGGLISIPDWIAGLWRGRFDLSANVLCGALYIACTVLDTMDRLGLRHLFPGLCATPNMPGLVTLRKAIGLGVKWLGIDEGKAQGLLDKALDYSCPTDGPGISEAIAAYLHDVIPLTEARQWGNVGNQCDYATDLQIDASKYRHGISEIFKVQQWRADRSGRQLRERLRAAGVLEPERQDELIDTQWTPWGVSECYEAFHRLRAGRVSDDLQYNEADLTRDLERLGYEARKVRQMVAMQATVLSARMHRAAYVSGAAGERQVRDSLYDDGYTRDAADILIAQFDQLRAAETWRAAGGQSPPALVRAAADGQLTVAELSQQLTLAGQTPTQVQQAERHVVQLQNQARRQHGLAVLKSCLKNGSCTPAAALYAAAQYGISEGAAAEMVASWQVEHDAEQKHASVAQLLQWARDNIVSYDDVVARLKALSYDDASIRAMVRAAQLKQSAAEQRMEAKNAAAAAKRAAAGAKTAKAAGPAKMAVARAAKVPAPPGSHPLAAGALKTLYVAGLMPAPEMKGRLLGMGYSEADSERLLDLARQAQAKAIGAAEKKAAGGAAKSVAAPPAGSVAVVDAGRSQVVADLPSGETNGGDATALQDEAPSVVT